MGEFVWTEEYGDGGDEEEELYTPPLSAKRKMRTPRKLEFIGWGSKPLIEFLQFIGTDTSNPISQFDVTAIINRYINDRSLLHQTKKKRVVCDEWLLPLFGRKNISRIRIYDLLEPHFAENQVVDSDDDGAFDSTDDEEDNEDRRLKPDKRTHCRKKVLETPKSCFAAIVPDNVKLVYLKRSLVQQLLKDQPDAFRSKIIGSFVRIKSDPNDYLQKYSHMLVQVTGVKEASGTNDSNAEILLQVSNFIKDVQISMLSDENFSKEECEDLSCRVRDGLLRRPTIVELEEKVHVLHEDITNHWLHGELALLQKLIDRANEKGWRRELFEYMERRQRLQTQDEQTRLLHDVPEVIADEIEVEPAPESVPLDTTQGNHASPKSSCNGTSAIPNCDVAAAITSPTWISFTMDTAAEQAVLATTKQSNGVDFQHAVSVKEQQKQPTDICWESNRETLPVNNIGENKHTQGLADVQVIDSSDGEEDEEPNHSVQILDCDPGSFIWHYADPQGEIQGPFAMTSLKRWNNADYFPPDFKVWKTGQSRKDAVLLSDILQQLFPNKL